MTCISQSHAHTTRILQGKYNENMTAVLISSIRLTSFDGNSQNLFPNLAYVLERIPIQFCAFLFSGKCLQLLISWQNCVSWWKNLVFAALHRSGQSSPKQVNSFLDSPDLLQGTPTRKSMSKNLELSQLSAV